jgi:hypothetical protein
MVMVKALSPLAFLPPRKSTQKVTKICLLTQKENKKPLKRRARKKNGYAVFQPVARYCENNNSSTVLYFSI